MGVHVERAVGRRQLGDPGLRQAVDQDRAVLVVPLDVTIEFVRRVERGEGGDL